MAVVEGAHEGETGSAVETPDHGMGAYCEAHEWVSWAAAPGEGKMEVPLNSPNMEHYVLVEVAELQQWVKIFYFVKSLNYKQPFYLMSIHT